MNENIIITRPTAEEYRKTIKMLNKIFMLNFHTLIPKLYSKNVDYKNDHFIVKNEGKIVGAIASIPNTVNLYGYELKARGIGMVGTKYSERGKGIMSLMLDRIYKEALEDDTDIMFLSGNFSRYNRHGFYPSGVNNIYKIRKNKAFIKNAKDFKFVHINGNERDLAQIEKIYNQQDVRWKRDNFYLTLKNWKRKACFIYKGEELKGYLVYSSLTNIHEIITINSNIIEILTAWLCQKGRDSVMVESSLYLKETNALLLENSENFTQGTTESWSILNWQRVLEVMFNVKLKNHALKKGKVVISLDDEKYLIDVQENLVKVSSSTKEADVILTKGMATRIFFGVNEGVKTGNDLLDSYLPLPIYISSCDTM